MAGMNGSPGRDTNIDAVVGARNEAIHDEEEAYERKVETDAELLLRVRNGDQDAYGILWERNICSSRVVAYSLTGSPIETDDLVSDAYARVYRAIRGGNGPRDGFRPYLHTTIRNLAKRNGSRAKTLSMDDDYVYQSHVSQGDLSATLVDRENKSLVSAAFYALNKRYRAAVWLSQVEGMPHAEVAEQLQVSVDTAYQIISRGKKRLREIYFELVTQQLDGDDAAVEAREPAAPAIAEGVSVEVDAVDAESLGPVLVKNEAIQGNDGSKAGLPRRTEDAPCNDEGNATDGKKKQTKLGKRVAGGVLGISASIGTDAGIANAVGGVNGVVAPVATSWFAAGAGASVVTSGVVLKVAATVFAIAVATTGLTAVEQFTPNAPASVAQSKVSGDAPVGVSRCVRADGTVVEETSPRPSVAVAAASGNASLPACAGEVVASPSPSPSVAAPQKSDQNAGKPNTVPKNAVASQGSPASIPLTIKAAGMGNPPVCYPKISGTGNPGSTVTVTSLVTAPVTTTVDAAGNWSVPVFASITSGSKTFTARDSNGNTRSVTVTIVPPPTLGTHGVAGEHLQVVVHGTVGAVVMVSVDSIDVGTVTIDSSGRGQKTLDYVVGSGQHAVSVRYYVAGSSGPGTSIVVAG